MTNPHQTADYARAEAEQLRRFYGNGPAAPADPPVQVSAQEPEQQAGTAHPEPTPPTHAEMLNGLSASIGAAVAAAVLDTEGRAAAVSGPVDLDELGASDAFKAWKERMES